MKSEVRTLAKIHHTECKDADQSGVTVTFIGSNSRGKNVKFKIRLGWWVWPYLVREIAKAWLPVRASRLSEISTLDKTLNKEAA